MEIITSTSQTFEYSLNDLFLIVTNVLIRCKAFEWVIPLH